jgi:ABC-type dipeptide/oligopeptide/nickel transport system permease component
MRRLLNLNQPSTIFLKVISFFVVLLSAVLYGIVLAWSETGIIRTLLLSTIKVSFAVGAFVFIVLLVLIVVEQIQDHCYDVRYQKQRSQKVLLASGYYECQYCGNQKVLENDQSCNVCGKEFTLERSR